MSKRIFSKWTPNENKNKSKTGSSGACRPFFHSDGGFSTVGMVIALLLTLSLIFSAAQVHRIQSISSEVQNVADAAALAAENQVASFYVVIQVCDAAVLSLSLTGLIMAGAGAVALCVPACQPIAATLIEAADKVIRMRDTFAESAARGLNALQALLPFIAAAQSASVASANNTSHATYLGMALLLPLEGKELTYPSLTGAHEALDTLHSKGEEIASAAEEAEEASREANEHKMRAFMADCGNEPGYCMSERARSLASMAGGENPLFSQVDNWSFSVPLARARAYYGRRALAEAPHSSSVDEQQNSVLRKQFYEYASGELARGYVVEREDSFESYFPLLPKNTDEMRQSSLYQQAVYPVTVDEHGIRYLHAWDGCPGIAECGHLEGYASLQQFEAEGMSPCPFCCFSPVSLGEVAAASTSIENGFEHHYRIVAEEARLYQKARERLEPAMKQVKEPVGSILDNLENAMKAATTTRLDDAFPPGAYGALALVVNTKVNTLDNLAPVAFFSSDSSLGPSAALSGATLAQDQSTPSGEVVDSLLDGFMRDSSGVAAFLPHEVLKLWGTALRFYTQGFNALDEGMKSVLGSIPIASQSGLGDWASKRFHSAADAVGLQPADTAAWKPVTVNSWHVAQADPHAPASDALLRAKHLVVHLSSNSSAPLSGIVDASAAVVEEEIDGIGTVRIAEISLGDEQGPSIPIEIALPSGVKDAGKDLLGRARDALKSLTTSPSQVKPWS